MPETDAGAAPRIYVDADACPVKEEVLRVAGRHGLRVFMVSNRWFQIAPDPLVERVIVAEGADKADDWIAGQTVPGDIAITADVPLAARVVAAGAVALSPAGKPFTPDTIGMAVAMRNLGTDLRAADPLGLVTRGSGKAFGPADRARFLQALENAVRQSLKRRTGA